MSRNKKTKRILFCASVIAGVLFAVGRDANADFTFGEPVNLESVIPVLDAAYDAIDCLSYDGLELFVDSKRPNGYGDWDICVLRRTMTDSEWDSPENLGSAVNSPKLDTGATITADGLEIYFISDRPGGHGRADIYMTKRATKSEPWGPCVNLGPKVNGSAVDSGPWISPDGLELYFDSWRPDGYGKGDLWVTTREATTDSWAEPVNLGVAVNSPDYEGSPFISADGRMLFFHSDRQGGHGQADIWMTRRASISDPWELPVNLGSRVNGATDESYPRLSPDGRTIYFWSGRNENFQVPIVPICDFNGDGIVDASDMCIVLDHWGESYPLCDVGPMPWGDGMVDVHDLIVLAGHLFEEAPLVE